MMTKSQALRIGREIARVMKETVYLVHDPSCPDSEGWLILGEQDLPGWEDYQKITITKDGEVTE